MEVHEKRRLLENINILIVRPGDSNETTLAYAIVDFQKLICSLTKGQITILMQVNEE